MNHTIWEGKRNFAQSELRGFSVDVRCCRRANAASQFRKDGPNEQRSKPLFSNTFFRRVNESVSTESSMTGDDEISDHYQSRNDVAPTVLEEAPMLYVQLLSAYWQCHWKFCENAYLFERCSSNLLSFHDLHTST